jgi:hypothetical protein
MPSAQVAVAFVDEDPSAYEAKHVHQVYDQIASHFSSTRYKVRVRSPVWLTPNLIACPALANHITLSF